MAVFRMAFPNVTATIPLEWARVNNLGWDLGKSQETTEALDMSFLQL